MKLRELVNCASTEESFETLDDFIFFARRYLDFIDHAGNLQARIVSQNENHYQFFQYKEDGHFNITRPLNSHLLIPAADSEVIDSGFREIIGEPWKIDHDNEPARILICKSIYTIQQCIGAALDALPANRANTARKLNGDLFERLILLLIRGLGIDCAAGTVRIPITVDGIAQFNMSYQHDLIIKEGETVKVIGGVKTSSKDRLDKVFIDKYLYCKLTDSCIPHIAIFLNDVQRKNTKLPNRYGVNATFLPGHFKGYTIKLNPLDGVYYCDIRPNMQTDPFLSQHIRTIDHFFCEDLGRFVALPGAATAKVLSEKRLP
ncbi:MAG TPA: hypothetical protein VF278_15815 [Pirellulales bacterium]